MYDTQAIQQIGWNGEDESEKVIVGEQSKEGKDCACESEKTKTAFIYTLSDPETGHIRYVGKTFNRKGRLKAHVKCKGNTWCANWIKSLRPKGLIPIMEVIEEIVTENHLEGEAAEMFWIETLKFYGCRLTNLDSGGGGGRRIAPEVRRKMSSSHKGKKKSLQWRMKIGAAHLGMKRSEEAKRNMRVPKNPKFGEMVRARMTGYKHTDAARLNMKLSKQNMSPEWKAKIVAAARARRGVKNTWGDKIRAKLLGTHRPESVKQKLREANLGKKHSDESKAKMSATRKALGAAGLHWKQLRKHALARQDVYLKLGYEITEG
jgi:hypothetical protein